MKNNIHQKNYLVFCFALDTPLFDKVYIPFCCPDTDQDHSFPEGNWHRSEAGWGQDTISFPAGEPGEEELPPDPTCSLWQVLVGCAPHSHVQ